MAEGARAARVGWIDWLRALGACAVVLLHVLVSTNLAVGIEGVRATAYAVVGIALCRWAVPGFFMISGYLLLDPGRTVGWAQVRRYAGRMVVTLATFGFVFALMQEALPQVRAGSVHVGELVLLSIRDVLTAGTWDHLWYVYALLGVYLLVPAVRLVGDWRDGRGLRCLTAFLVVLGLVVPTIWQALAAWGAVAAMPFGGLATYASNLLAGLACFCVGGCLREAQRPKALMALGVVSLAVMLATSLWGLGVGRGDQGYVFLQTSVFACGYAAGVLELARAVVGEEPPRAGGVIEALARDSFGVYVLHPLFVHLELMALDPLALPPVLFELGSFVAVLALSVASTRLLRRVPLVGTVL